GHEHQRRRRRRTRRRQGRRHVERRRSGVRQCPHRLRGRLHRGHPDHRRGRTGHVLGAHLVRLDHRRRGQPVRLGRGHPGPGGHELRERTVTGIFSREPEYTWAETKELLDDPHVSAETKQAVLKHYSLRGDNDSAADAYYEKYNVRPGWADPIWDDRRRPYDWPADPYEDARAEAEEKGYRSSQIESELDENRGKLVEATVGTGSTGYTTSDELLELAKDGLDTFHKFLPIDAQVPADSQRIDGPLDYAADIRERYWEQAGIDFQKFLDDADALRTAHGTLSELRSSTEDDLNALYRDWTGDAANASYQKYSEDIDPPAKDLVSHVEGAAAVIERAVES